MTEAEFRALVKDRMTDAGWTVLLDLSDRRRSPPGAKGAPDILFVTHQDILVWFEAKAPGKKRRADQLAWHEKVQPHLRTWHRYVVAATWEEWLDAIHDLLKE